MLIKSLKEKLSLLLSDQEKDKNGTLKDYKYIQEFRNRDSRMYVSILMPFKSWYESNYGDKFVYEWIRMVIRIKDRI